MFSKSNVIATLVAGATMFIFGYVLWGILAESMMDGHVITNVMKDPPDFLLIALGNVISAFALSALYSKWARGTHSVKEGAEFGAVTGIFAGLGTALVTYATASFMDLTGHLLDAVLSLVFFIVVGIVIAMVYKATSK